MPNVQAFLFTADRDDRSGQYALRFYGRALDGNSTRPIEVVITNVPPVFFVERGLELPEYIRYRERRPVELRTLNGQDVDALYFNGEYDLRQAREQLRARGFKTYEGDVNSGDRYLMERFLNGAVTVSGECRSHNHTLIFENPKIQPGTARIKPITASIDIETGVADNRLYSIAVDILNADQDS
ncbi:MAG: hypothetical protein KDK27_20055, partial [Leptospiraceae bacterium]|nr:hypothetical protein [Leptospiraceae bacterium]